MRTKAVPKDAKVVSTGASKPELKKKVLQGAGKIMSKKTPDKQSKGKFAAGDPFFWPAEKTGSDDEGKDEDSQKLPFSPSMKQRLPPRRSSFGKTAAQTGKHRHSTAFSPAAGNSGRPQALRKAPVSTGKRHSDSLKELGECMASGHDCSLI
ncbi:hypothetical protein HPB49_005903 [Dermacentor silvarum]|uniref:Uncharacterized protein n=1 Tax=Dermacentor silvarum TaxID=543639 RepID=A0ACB8DB99_DERSI|nr:hypothetical protein HPB49_005903 [Dermacentor silvarum]